MYTEKNIVYGKLGNERQVLDIHLPNKKDFDTLIYVHGGGIVEGSKDYLQEPNIEYLVSNGIAVVKPNYRLYPNAKYPEFICDVAEAVAWVFNNIKSKGGNGRIFVGGSSAGAYITMMLCFNEEYLKSYGISPLDIKGWIHDSGQPTVHFHVLKEQGLDSRKVMISKAAPIYYVKQYNGESPMLFASCEFDMPGRLEQIKMFVSNLIQFGYPKEKVKFIYFPGYKHCEYRADACYNDEIINFIGGIQ